MKRLIIISFILGVFFISSCSQNNGVSSNALQTIGISKGQIPPDFSIKTIDGKEIKLSDFRGDRPVLLYFWASWCPYCKQDLSIAKSVYPKYSDKVAFLAIDLDLNENEQLIKKYKDSSGLSGVDFAEGDEKILTDYQITRTTTKYAIGKNGAIIYKASGVFSKEQWEILLEGLTESS